MFVGFTKIELPIFIWFRVNRAITQIFFLGSVSVKHVYLLIYLEMTWKIMTRWESMSPPLTSYLIRNKKSKLWQTLYLLYIYYTKVSHGERIKKPRRQQGQHPLTFGLVDSLSIPILYIPILLLLFTLVYSKIKKKKQSLWVYSHLNTHI